MQAEHILHTWNRRDKSQMQCEIDEMNYKMQWEIGKINYTFVQTKFTLSIHLKQNLFQFYGSSNRSIRLFVFVGPVFFPLIWTSIRISDTRQVEFLYNCSSFFIVVVAVVFVVFHSKFGHFPRFRLIGFLDVKDHILQSHTIEWKWFRYCTL